MHLVKSQRIVVGVAKGYGQNKVYTAINLSDVFCKIKMKKEKGQISEINAIS